MPGDVDRIAELGDQIDDLKRYIGVLQGRLAFLESTRAELKSLEEEKMNDWYKDYRLASNAEIERLKKALHEIRDEIVYGGGDMTEEPDVDKIHDIARRALREVEQLRKDKDALEQHIAEMYYRYSRIASDG